MAPCRAAVLVVAGLTLGLFTGSFPGSGDAARAQTFGFGAPAGETARGDETTIREVVVRGNQRIEPATIRSYLTLRPGDPFDPDELDTSLKNLFGTGLFDDVELLREGDTLVVHVTENPIINRIAFEGNERLDDETLSAEVQLRPRIVYTRSRVQNAVNRILELYRRNGRFGATVEPKVIRLPQNRVDLVFEINEGPLTQVQKIVFIGNQAYSDGTLRGVIQTKEAAFWRFLTSDDTYDPDRLAFDQELLRRYYLNRGYADFNVRSAIAELTPDGRAFVITFTVEEGLQYTFGEINLESRIRDLEPGALRELIQTESGDIYDAEQVENSIVALTEELGNLGYAFVEITPDINKRTDEQIIDLTYVINEGPRVYVERIDITGNVRTLDEVIRREFRLAEGDAFNSALLRRSRERIQNLGFFESVDFRTERGTTPDRTRVEVEVQERSTGELSFGAGFSTTDGPLGDIRLSERNLLGRGQQLRANFLISGRTQQIDLSFTEPYFLGYDLAAGFDLFRRETDFQDESSFDERTTGGTLRGDYALTDRWRHGLRMTVRSDEIFNINDDASVFIQQEEGDALTVLLGQSFTWDDRDSRFLPNEGGIFQLDQDLAGFGADTDFFKNEILASYYYSIVPDWVVNVGTNIGYVFGYAGDGVRLFDRFFLGGDSFRGFSFAGVGPRDSETDDSLGGNLLATGTAELRFPLGLPEEFRVFGRVFGITGTLTGIDVSGPTLLDDSSLRASAGVGISWVSPLGPIAVDFAEPFLREDFDNVENFRISFGTRF